MRILTYIFIFLTFGTFAQEFNLQFTFEDEMTKSSLDSVQIKIYSTSNKLLINQWVENNEIIETFVPTDQVIKIKSQKTGYFTLDTIVDLSFYERNIRKDKAVLIKLVLYYDGQLAGEYN